MSYLNVVEVESALLALAGQYPALCSIIQLPDSTVEGRTCHALRIGKGGTPKTHGILFTGCAHAREWGGAEICIYFAADLLEGYAGGTGLSYGGRAFSAGDIRRIVEDMDVFVFPCVNPDGRHFSQTKQAMWRKNRNPASGGGNPLRIGVDINRNHDFLWDFRKHFHPSIVANSPYLSSDDPGDDLYHGTAPHSEPESRNVVWLLDQNPQIRWYMDIHSYTGDILYPWGDAPDQSSTPVMNLTNPLFDGKRGVDDTQVYGEYITKNDRETCVALAGRVRNSIAAVRGQSYEVHQSFYLEVGHSGQNLTYPTSGTVDDYVFGRHITEPGKPKVYAFTLEFGIPQDFHPPWSEMQDIVLDIDAGMLEFCLQAKEALVPPRVPQAVVDILFGVTQDGGGKIRLPGGKVVPIPPWDPWIRGLLNGILIHELATRLGDSARREIRRDALKGIIAAAQRQLELETGTS